MIQSSPLFCSQVMMKVGCREVGLGLGSSLVAGLGCAVCPALGAAKAQTHAALLLMGRP